MTLLSDIAAYLVSNSIGTSANIFQSVSTFPDAPDLAFMLYDYRGSQSDHTHSGERVRHANIQIITRGVAGPTASNTAAKTKADAIDTLLDGLSNATVGSTFVMLCTAQAPPVTYGPDAKGRPLWEQSFNIMIR